MIMTGIQGYEKSLAKNEAKLVYLDVLSILNPQCGLSTPRPARKTGRGLRCNKINAIYYFFFEEILLEF